MEQESGRPGGLSSDDGAASVSTLRASIPDATIEEFCDSLQKPLEAKVKKLTDELYCDLLYSVQDYLRENAVFNIRSAFEASQREAITALNALAAVERSATLEEAKANAHAALKGYWSKERSEEFRAQGIEARRAETGTGSVHESPVA